jgi:enterochelin esterase-like enzyme
MPRFTFQVTVPPDPTRQRVVIVGTDPALGNWQPERGLVLERDADGLFRGACDLPYGLVEFKITRGSWETEEAFTDGTAAYNYQYLAVHDLDLALEVENWKDCAPIDPEQLHGKSIDIELDATQFGHHRRAAVWFPPSFMRSQDSRHPVLYLLDGQDALGAFAAPDNETLEAESWVRRLCKTRMLPELILVAVFHTEAFGQRDEEMSPQCDGPKMADFLVNDLKPFVDFTFCRDRTLSAPEHTGVLGFGLGGSLALWMALRHGSSFGRFACLSPWYEDLSGDTPAQCALAREVKSSRTLKPGRGKIYFDHGTLGADHDVHLYQEKITAALLAKKFVEGRDFMVNVAHGAEHTLTAWRARLGAPLQFLFGAAT